MSKAVPRRINRPNKATQNGDPKNRPKTSNKAMIAVFEVLGRFIGSLFWVASLGRFIAWAAVGQSRAAGYAFPRAGFPATP